MCEMTEGRNQGCDDVAGTKKVHLFSIKDSLGISNYATPPTIVDGEVTAIALKPTKLAYTFNVEAETAEGDSTSTGEKANSATAYEHRTVMVLSGNTADDIAQATKMLKDRVVAIMELQDGTYEIYHYENGAKVQRTRSIGKMLDDLNGSTLTLTSRQKSPEAKISSVLVAALLAG